jgi:hypothetical protein
MLLDPPPQMRVPPSDEDPPPVMPQDDPFKDDPPATSKPSGAPTKSGARDSRLNDEGGRQAAMRWQVIAQTTEAAGDKPSDKADNSDEAPRLLEPEGGGQDVKGLLPINPPTKQNPLRSAAHPSRTQRVTPVAHSSTERPPANAAVETSRRNPLRSN